MFMEISRNFKSGNFTFLKFEILLSLRYNVLSSFGSTTPSIVVSLQFTTIISSRNGGNFKLASHLIGLCDMIKPFKLMGNLFSLPASVTLQPITCKVLSCLGKIGSSREKRGLLIIDKLSSPCGKMVYSLCDLR